MRERECERGVGRESKTFGHQSFPSATVEEGWINVVNRRRAREDHMKIRNEGRMDISLGGEGRSRKNQNPKQNSTFFFTEFPEGYGARDMYKIFLDYGDVVEVIIPSKGDRRGKKYGFVRFKSVRDERSMVLQLDNIFIGRKKLHANVPRFQRAPLHKKQLEKVKNLSVAPNMVPKSAIGCSEKRVFNQDFKGPGSYAQEDIGHAKVPRRQQNFKNLASVSKNVWKPKLSQKNHHLHIYNSRWTRIIWRDSKGLSLVKSQPRA